MTLSIRSAAVPMLALAGLLLTSVPALARQEDEQFWFQANMVVPLNDRVRLTLEQITRLSDRQDGIYTTEFGGLAGYKLTDSIELGFGYRRVDFHNGNTARGENRLRQHVIATFGPVTTRLRLDERFHPAGNEVGFRIRPLIRYNHKLRTDGLALFVSHESFFLPNSTDWGQRAGYERMRNIAGVVLPIAKGVSGDLGYLNQYRVARGGARAQMDHALTFQLTVNLSGLVIHKADD